MQAPFLRVSVGVVIVVMGVAGSGKTRIGSALAESLGWPFVDADDLHPQANVAKMRSGIPLTDDDREPWLLAIVERLQGDLVLACSALRAEFRDRLGDAFFVYLKIDPATAVRRVAKREGHFMPPSLVESQFETLDEPVNVLTIDATRPVEEIVKTIRTALRRGTEEPEEPRNR